MNVEPTKAGMPARASVRVWRLLLADFRRGSMLLRPRLVFSFPGSIWVVSPPVGIPFFTQLGFFKRGADRSGRGPLADERLGLHGLGLCAGHGDGAVPLRPHGGGQAL